MRNAWRRGRVTAVTLEDDHVVIAELFQNFGRDGGVVQVVRRVERVPDGGESARGIVDGLQLGGRERRGEKIIAGLEAQHALLRGGRGRRRCCRRGCRGRGRRGRRRRGRRRRLLRRGGRRRRRGGRLRRHRLGRRCRFRFLRRGRFGFGRRRRCLRRLGRRFNGFFRRGVLHLRDVDHARAVGRLHVDAVFADFVAVDRAVVGKLLRVLRRAVDQPAHVLLRHGLAVQAEVVFHVEERGVNVGKILRRGIGRAHGVDHAEQHERRHGQRGKRARRALFDDDARAAPAAALA